MCVTGSELTIIRRGKAARRVWDAIARKFDPPWVKRWGAAHPRVHGKSKRGGISILFKLVAVAGAADATDPYKPLLVPELHGVQKVHASK